MGSTFLRRKPAMVSMIVEIKVTSCVAKVAEVTLSFVSREFAFQTNISAMANWTALQERMRAAAKKPDILKLIKALQIQEEKVKK